MLANETVDKLFVSNIICLIFGSVLANARLMSCSKLNRYLAFVLIVTTVENPF